LDRPECSLLYDMFSGPTQYKRAKQTNTEITITVSHSFYIDVYKKAKSEKKIYCLLILSVMYNCFYLKNEALALTENVR